MPHVQGPPNTRVFARILEVLAKHAAAAAAELGDQPTVNQYGTPQSDPDAARAYLDSVGPADPTEARFTVAPDGETTDCCSESHNTFNISVFNPIPEQVADSTLRAIRRPLSDPTSDPTGLSS